MQGLFIGMATLDIIHYLKGPVRDNEKAAAEQTLIHAGGPALHASITFSLLGGTASLVTFAGRNMLTRIIEQELSDHHVIVNNCSTEEGSSPVTASVLVDTDTGSRTVVGLKPGLEPNPAYFQEPTRPVDVVLFDTYFIDTAQPYLSWAHQEKIPTVLDGGSWKPGLERVLPCITYAVCSEQFMPPGCGTHDEAARFLLHGGVSTVCITRGEHPILLYSRSGAKQEVRVHSFGPAVDTLAAGDIFHGAFCYHIAEGKDLLSAVRASADRASRSVLYRGPRGWLKDTQNL